MHGTDINEEYGLYIKGLETFKSRALKKDIFYFFLTILFFCLIFSAGAIRFKIGISVMMIFSYLGAGSSILWLLDSIKFENILKIKYKKLCELSQNGTYKEEQEFLDKSKIAKLYFEIKKAFIIGTALFFCGFFFIDFIRFIIENVF